MKAIRVGMLASAVSFCALASLGQIAVDAARPEAGHSTSRENPRAVTFRPATLVPAGSTPATLSAGSPPVFGSIANLAAGGTPQQLFAHRQEVFVSAGPTASPCSFAFFLPDGKYYFQVTDASGKTLLSTDPVSERSFTVSGGVISSYDGSTHATDGKTACGSLAVGLFPYNDAGPMQALYVVWVTPAAAFDGDPTQVDPVCGTGCFHGFHTDLSLTDAFRVEDKASCDPSFCVSGVAFNDSNANGIQDPGETGLGGVPVRVESASGLVLTTVTAPDGSFQICGLTSGQSFLVTSTAPLGFNKTGPVAATVAPRVFSKDFAYVIEVCLENVPKLNFPSQPIPGAISGTKFEDLNANGARDPGEPPLAGVTITLTPAAGGTPQTQVTDASGNFLFTNVAAGDYVLTETVPTGFTQTLPASGSGGIPVTLAANGSSLDNLFGNFRGILTGTISGTKFNDLNGNGVRDPGEPGIAGVHMILNGCPSPCVQPPVGGATTAADGSFSITGIPLSPAPYFLSEAVPAGFRQTTPATAEIPVTVDLAHQTVTGLLFGNQAIAATISGTKFNDVNGNGARDAGEPGLPGVTITLKNTASGQTQTAITAADGSFAFTGLAAGTYLVSETIPAGFVQTAPGGGGTFTVTVATGDVRSDLLFGNQVAPVGTGSISGTKWFDIDANAVVNAPPDRPLAGVTINLTDSAGHTVTTVTAADGTFQFTNLAPGTYVLSETIPPGFAQTFPGTPDIPKTYTITLTTGQQATGFLFLNKC